jgi:hypothetical protein
MAKGKTDKPPPATTATTATRVANEWGIPDWRDAAAYGDVKRWGFMRWRWEFYRRREDLRAAFDSRAQETYDYYLKLHENPLYGTGRTLRPDEPGFTAQSYYEDPFGYCGIPNPRISEQPSDAIFAVMDYPGDNAIIRGKGARWPGTPETTVDLGDGELAVIFDLDKPLGPQLKRLKNELTVRQVSRHGAALQKRRHPAKWLGYLRTLDAREAMQGESWREYTDTLYKHGILDRHKSPSGGYCAPPPQAGRDIWGAANDLRFNF